MVSMNLPAASLYILKKKPLSLVIVHVYDTLRCFNVHELLESQGPGWVAQYPLVNLTLHELS